MAIAVSGGAPDQAAGESVEYEVKAAFLYNFAKFVEWPVDALGDQEAPLCIGIVGEDPFGEVIDRSIKRQSVHSRLITVKRFEKPEDLEPCHILFIDYSDSKRLKETLEGVEGTPVLTVGESDRFTRLGGVIRFFIARNRVRFEINNDVAEQSGLKLSSKLLKVAKVVGGEANDG
jgi:hypothetical protein